MILSRIVTTLPLLAVSCLGVWMALLHPSVVRAQTIQEADRNGDGVIDTWAYFHPGSTLPFKQTYDRTRDGKTDYVALVSETTGKVTAVDIDRANWPVLPSVGSADWMEAKRAAAAQFWASPPEGSAVIDSATGEVLLAIPPSDPSHQTAICDVCNAQVQRGHGFVLSTQEILSSRFYVQHVASSNRDLAEVFGLDPMAHLLQVWEAIFEQATATPWLVCEQCFSNWMHQE